MARLITSILTHETVHDWYEVAIFLFVMATSFVAKYGRFFNQWLSGIRGRDWASVSAVVEVVSVVVQTEERRTGEYIVGYLATLTYFYRNPELQMGEFSRMFGEENDAKAWTLSYKGKAVMVHLDPNDPSHSVLRREDLT
jgi:hypothetical protein